MTASYVADFIPMLTPKGVLAHRYPLKEDISISRYVWARADAQTTMPFGTASDVKRKTMELINMCRENGRLILAPTHLLEPEVPLENVGAFVDTIREFERNKIRTDK